MNQLVDFISSLPPVQASICHRLHSYLCDDLGLTAKLRYGIPFYDRYSWICYLKPLKSGGVELAFIDGKELLDEDSILEFYNRKQVGGITFHHAKDCLNEALERLLQQAILLDEIKQKTRSKKK